METDKKDYNLRKKSRDGCIVVNVDVCRNNPLSVYRVNISDIIDTTAFFNRIDLYTSCLGAKIKIDKPLYTKKFLVHYASHGHVRVFKWKNLTCKHAIITYPFMGSIKNANIGSITINVDTTDMTKLLSTIQDLSCSSSIKIQFTEDVQSSRALKEMFKHVNAFKEIKKIFYIDEIIPDEMFIGSLAYPKKVDHIWHLKKRKTEINISKKRLLMCSLEEPNQKRQCITSPIIFE